MLLHQTEVSRGSSRARCRVCTVCPARLWGVCQLQVARCRRGPHGCPRARRGRATLCRLQKGTDKPSAPGGSVSGKSGRKGPASPEARAGGGAGGGTDRRIPLENTRRSRATAWGSRSGQRGWHGLTAAPRPPPSLSKWSPCLYLEYEALFPPPAPPSFNSPIPWKRSGGSAQWASSRRPTTLRNAVYLHCLEWS